MKGVVRLPIPHHLDEQLVARGKITRRHFIVLIVLKDRLDLKVRNRRELDGANAFFFSRGDGVLVGNRTIAKGLAAVVVAGDNLLVVLCLLVYVNERVGNAVARLIDADLCVSAVVIVVLLAANLDLADMALVGTVIRRYLASARFRNHGGSIKGNGGDVVVRTIRLAQSGEQVPVVCVGRVKSDGGAGRLLNAVLIRIGLAEGVGGLFSARRDAHQEAIEDIAVLDLGATDNVALIDLGTSVSLNLKILAQDNRDIVT